MLLIDMVMQIGHVNCQCVSATQKSVRSQVRSSEEVILVGSIK